MDRGNKKRRQERLPLLAAEYRCRAPGRRHASTDAQRWPERGDIQAPDAGRLHHLHSREVSLWLARGSLCMDGCYIL